MEFDLSIAGLLIIYQSAVFDFFTVANMLQYLFKVRMNVKSII